MEAFSVCTVVARNYLPRARVLARSLQRHHPGSTLAVLVIDDETGRRASGEPFRTLSLSQVGLGNALGHEMAGIYSVLELSTAVKPWLLSYLLTDTGRPVLYLDPDCEVYAPIDHLAELAGQHHLVVTPHLLTPLPRDGRTPDEAYILAAGVYNLGFLGVGPGALDSGFFPFWQQRLRRDGIVDVPNMLFTDQRWVDFIDCFPHHVLRDPACNVAYWNVAGRPLSRHGDTVMVDGKPLVFFHYSGFDPTRPYLLTIHQGERPRILLSDHPVLAWLCRRYGRRVLAEGYEEAVAAPYGWSTTPSGRTMDPMLRRMYRAGLNDAERRGQPPPPNPFERSEEFEAWIESAELGATRLPTYLHALWTLHRDLQEAFPDPLANEASADAFRRWTGGDIDTRMTAIPDALRRRLADGIARSPAGDSGSPGGGAGPAPPRPGLNVLGYLHAELGVGQAARLMLRAAGAAGLPVSARSTQETTSSLAHRPGHGWDDQWSFDTNVFCVNADMLPAVRNAVPGHMIAGRTSAGLWFWEAEEFPSRFWDAFDLVDEVWAPSAFVARALERTGRGPVVQVSLPVDVPTWRTMLTRQDLGLPDGFLVLFTFDFASVVERKNPFGLIDAYRRAFAPEDGAHLVLKSVGGDIHWRELEQLRSSIDRPDIHLMDGFVRWHQVKAMMERCDCYASLHRAEGFGLGMAEAMALGRPVVATAWSANMEFMDETTAYLVPAELVPIPAETPAYGGLGRWAEPDLDAAARALRQIHDDPVGAAAVGGRARAHLAATRDPATTGRQLATHAERLRRARRSAA